MMSALRMIYRLSLLGIHLLYGLWITATHLRHLNNNLPSPRQQQIITRWMRRLSLILGLQIEVKGELPKPPVLVVANHISWLDIPVLMSLLPVTMISMAEVKQWPVVGVLAMRSGTLFIQRGAVNAARQAAEQMTWRLVRGSSVAVFPEGMSTSGETVQRFHARLFSAAVYTSVKVQPVALQYPHPNGVNPCVSLVNNPNLVHHTLRVMAHPHTQVKVTLAKPIVTAQQDRRTVAELAYRAIRHVVAPDRISPGDGEVRR